MASGGGLMSIRESSDKPSAVDDTLGSFTKPSTDPQTDQQNLCNVLLDTKFQKVKDIDVKVLGDKYTSVHGLCFMPDGRLVLCDNTNKRLKVLDSSLSVVDSLDMPGEPWQVAVVDNRNVVVALMNRRKLQFVQVLPSLKIGRTIDVYVECRSVAVADGKIFVFGWGSNTNEIRVYDLEGRYLEKRLGSNSDGPTLSKPGGFAHFSSSGDKIFVSHWDTNTVSCFTSDGNIVYEYSDDEFRHPCELFVDDYDNVIACNGYGCTLQVITAAGKKHTTLLSREDGVCGPQCVSFRPNDGTLVVCCGNFDLKEYKMSK